jgi:DNA transformation protein and related proteins
MAGDSDYLNYVLDCLSAARGGAVTRERLFSGSGLRIDGELFGVILRGVLYFVVDDQTRPRFVEAGMGPFTYARKEVQREVPRWYELPEDVLTDADELRDWVREALGAVRRTAKPEKKSAAKKSATRPKVAKPKITKPKTAKTKRAAAPKTVKPKAARPRTVKTARKPARRKVP